MEIIIFFVDNNGRDQYDHALFVLRINQSAIKISHAVVRVLPSFAQNNHFCRCRVEFAGTRRSTADDCARILY